MDITARQQALLEAIRQHQQECGLPPTKAELAVRLGVRSLNAVENHLAALARKGYLLRTPGTSRGIRLTPLAEALWGEAGEGLPLIGQVAAGRPILAVEHIEDYPRVPPDLFRPRADYLLTVRGDSMIEAGIQDGDWLAVQRREQARSGEIVVARLGEEVTVKRLRHEGDQLWLLPAHPRYAPIPVLPEQGLQIEGVMVGLIRRGSGGAVEVLPRETVPERLGGAR